MASQDVKLQIDDDPDFDDSDLYDDDVVGTMKIKLAADQTSSISLLRSDIQDQNSTLSLESTNPSIVPVITETTKSGGDVPSAESENTRSITVEHASEAIGHNLQIQTDDVAMEDGSAKEPPSRESLLEPLLNKSTSAIKLDPNVPNAEPLMFDRNFIEAARANRDDPEAEFEEDSDPEVSDDSSGTSDSDSDDSSSDDDSDYGSVILDPAEAARMLMRASPEDGGAASGPPRTVNEQQEKPLAIPVIADINDIPIVELGVISHIITPNKCVVIKATIHLRHNVLQPGSALCLANRTLIRPISDTIAQVYDPYYVSYFESSDEMTKFGIEEGIKIFYVDSDAHRKFVFYEDLKKQRFTDASNINDEEVNDYEEEFSDDEKEAAAKKAAKKKRQQRNADRQDGELDDVSIKGDDDASQDGVPQHRGRGNKRGHGQNGRPHRGGRGGRGRWLDADRRPEVTYAPSSADPPAGGLDYGDGGADGDYTKLERPDYPTWQPTPVPAVPPATRSDYNRPRSSNGEFNQPRSERAGFRSRRGNRGGHDDRGGNRGRGGSYQQPPMNNIQAPQNQPYTPFAPQITPTNPEYTMYQQNSAPDNRMYQQYYGASQNGGHGNQYGSPNPQFGGGMQFGNGGQQSDMNMPQFGGGTFAFGFGMPFNGFNGFQGGSNGNQNGQQ
jgi:H/ACA ribonucleoprotein complex non-core subunit NAF1